MNRTPDRPGTDNRPKPLRALAGIRTRISLAPGAPPRQATVAAAINTARAAIGRDAPEVAIHIGEQLRRLPGAMVAATSLQLQALLYLGRAGDALTAARRLLALGVSETDDVLGVMRALQMSGRHEQAIELLSQALARDPRSARLLHARGELLGEIGDHGAAASTLRALLDSDRRFFAAWRSLAQIVPLSDADIAWLEAAAPATTAERIAAWSALAFAWRERGDPAREFLWLDRAQALLAAQDPWVCEDETEIADALLARLDRAWFAAREPAAVTPGPRPIFVLGMPRSGSTLTEQILVSADGVEAAGETGIFPWLLLDLARRRYGEPPYPEIADRLSAQDIANLRRDYLAEIQRVYTQAPAFVDKQFTNWKYLGLLALVLPEALFVHTLRDPLDTCLSTYQQAFYTLGYGHNLEHVARLHLDQDRVMAHWKTLFPARIHTVRYEQLVAEPETEIRRLYEFCGLPWSERALRFHETRRGVRTASARQVRQPLYRTSVKKAERYAAQLEPARRVLGLTAPARPAQ